MTSLPLPFIIIFTIWLCGLLGSSGSSISPSTSTSTSSTSESGDAIIEQRLQAGGEALSLIPNKIIYILWLQGVAEAPELVHRCIHSWRYYNPDWAIVVLNQTSLSAYLSPEEMAFLNSKPSLSRAHYADIVRLMLLDRHGGVWADATVFCHRPLNEWLPAVLTYHDAFFAFSWPAAERRLANWLLYAKAGGYLIGTWKDFCMGYHKEYEEVPWYFIHHYIFNGLYDGIEEFRNSWDEVLTVQANDLGPHYLLIQGYFSEITDEVKSVIDSKASPLYKLSWHNFTEQFRPNTIVDYLFRTVPYSETTLNNMTKSEII